MPSYGKRADGSEKGPGYFGELARPDGGISTEISIGIDLGGGEIEIPLIVPGITKKELDSLLAGDPPTPELVDKAAHHAMKRLNKGKSPFAGPGEQVAPPSKQTILGE